jgi:hypothetical protein
MTAPPPMWIRAARAAAAALVAIAAGCLRVPDGPVPMCHRTSDCDTGNGQVCQEGVCWGDPPVGPFAAVVSPPATRRDLVSRELPPSEFMIPQDGLLRELTLDSPALISGRLVASCSSTLPPAMACDASALGATITVTRKSQFPGGPGFKTVVSAAADADSFSIPVPPAAADGTPYLVTIAPSAAQPGSGRSAATLVPPLRMVMSAVSSASTRTLVLGGPDLPVLSGVLMNGNGEGLEHYRVVALGRWDATESATEVSSVDTTDVTGGYAVTLSDQLVGTVELVARPPDGTVAPTIHIASIDPTQSSLHNVVEPVDLGSAATLPIQVIGADLSGAVSGVAGAVVTVSGVFSSALTSYVVSDTQVTGDGGAVVMHLLDGPGIARSYRLSIIPPAGSTLGAMFDQGVALGDPPARKLASRIALRGRITDTAHRPLGNVAITARPSLRFLWTLDTTPQALLAAVPTATAVTADTGEFVVWVDPRVGLIWGDYDLVIEPPVALRAPSYVQSGIAIPRNSALDGLALGEIAVPDAAFVHGRIAVAPNGEPVAGAELKLYRVSPSLALCSEVAHAPPSCPIPAQLQARNTSDAKGMVRLALPR